MDETILYPAPNWFQVSGFTVSTDGWLVYGGPCRSLCVLEPVPREKSVFRDKQTFRSHILNRAHNEKVVSVDLNPEWPTKRTVLTGSIDGSVKEWMIEQVEDKWRIKSIQTHEVHVQDREEVTGVGYGTSSVAVSTGNCGRVVKWDLNSNVAKTCNLLKNMKPTCLACSPHQPLVVAVGTRQGVIFVIDLNEPFKLIYKIRGQDDEITKVSWCPQFEVTVKKLDSVFLHKKSSPLEKSKKTKKRSDKKEKESDAKIEREQSEDWDIINSQGDESCDEKVVEKDDGPFDIYKDHETDEFGHKKYVPEEVMVKVKKDEEPQDYLEQCKLLKEDILKLKNKPEATIESLVDALEQTHVENKNGEVSMSTESAESPKKALDDTGNALGSETPSKSSETYEHLLVTIGRYGTVRVWSKTGKLVSSCGLHATTVKPTRSKTPSWTTALWYKPDLLLLADARSQLVECNPLEVDCKNKLQWDVLHSLHRRGLSSIASSAPRVQTGDLPITEHSVWTVAQDRNIINYSLATRKDIAQYATCGGFPYMVVPCPYDAGRFAASVGDGAVRVWNMTSSEEEGPHITEDRVFTYWQNVQGKVLTVAWHPTKENLIAFATGESRIGLIDACFKTEKPARVLMPTLNGAIYSLFWGQDNDLYACGGNVMMRYDVTKPSDSPVNVTVELEGQQWEMSTGRWYPNALLVGSRCGAIAALEPEAPHKLITAAFIFSKMIHTIDWHPADTTHSSDDSPYKNLIAVCALDKESNIVILEYSDKEDGGKQFLTWKTLSGHKAPVLQVIWNPHLDGQLLSTSQDGTVRVWDVVKGVCMSIFGGHTGASLAATWIIHPHLHTKVLTGGGDCSLRIWDVRDHPAESYVEIKHEVIVKSKKKKEKKEVKEVTNVEDLMLTENIAATQDHKLRAPKKFVLPTLYKQINECRIEYARRLLNKYLKNNAPEGTEIPQEPETNGQDHDKIDFTDMFGTHRQVAWIISKELCRHLMTGCVESWIMLNIFRGDIDAVIKFAAHRDLLCPFVLGLAPAVSIKYWKDTTKQYLAQIDRLIARGEGEKILVSRLYGGPVYRKTATLLNIHDIKTAVEVLVEARLYLEAYVLCRIRYMDSIAEDLLKQWADFCVTTGVYHQAATLYIALGNLSQAATVLSKSIDEEWLSLAAELAKLVGQNTYADHISEKREQLISSGMAVCQSKKVVPKKLEELLMDYVNNGENAKEEVALNGGLFEEKIINGDTASNGDHVAMNGD